MSKSLLPCLAILSLSACGGGGGGASMTAGGSPTALQSPGLFDQSTASISDLALHAASGAGGAIAMMDGELDRGANTAVLNGVAATVSGDRLTMTAGTTHYVLSNTGTEHVASFSTQSPTQNPIFGVIGIPSATGDHPVGLANYAGTGQVQVIDGQAVYDLSGSSSASVDFTSATGRVDMSISDLSGTRTAANGATSTVQNAGSLAINRASLSGLNFSGGEATLTSGSFANTLTGTESVTSSGGIYGPGGTEIGAVLRVDDTANGGLLINGTLTGK